MFQSFTFARINFDYVCDVYNRFCNSFREFEKYFHAVPSANAHKTKRKY